MAGMLFTRSEYVDDVLPQSCADRAINWASRMAERAIAVGDTEGVTHIMTAIAELTKAKESAPKTVTVKFGTKHPEKDELVARGKELGVTVKFD